MDRHELELRTKRFALDSIRAVSLLRPSRANDVVGRQLLKSATSVGANYREAVHAESRADFAHKIAVVAKEASETQYWLELLMESGERSEAIDQLWRECDELLRIFISSRKTARAKSRRE